MAEKAPAEVPILPKKAKAPFFIFATEYRQAYPGEEFKDLSSSALSEQWKTLSEDERARFIDLAKQDKERYRKELEEYKRHFPDADDGSQLLKKRPSQEAVTGNEEDISANADGVRKELGFGNEISISAIAKVVKKDSEVKVVSKEAKYLICGATELFLSHLTKRYIEKYPLDATSKRFSIRNSNLNSISSENPELNFLNVALFMGPSNQKKELSPSKAQEKSRKRPRMYSPRRNTV